MTFWLIPAVVSARQVDCRVTTSRVHLQQIFDRARYEGLSEGEKRAAVVNGVRYVACSGTASELESLLQLVEEVRVSEHDFREVLWKGISKRKEGKLAEVAVKYCAFDKWPDAAIEAALNQGSYECLQHEYPSTATYCAIQNGQVRLATELGLSADEILRQFTDHLEGGLIDEDQKLRMLDYLGTRLDQQELDKSLNSALKVGQPRVEARLRKLGATVSLWMVESSVMDDVDERVALAILREVASSDLSSEHLSGIAGLALERGYPRVAESALELIEAPGKGLVEDVFDSYALDEDHAIEILDRFVPRLEDGHLASMLKDSLSKGRYRLATHLLELGAVPDSYLVIDLARSGHREALTLIGAFPTDDFDCEDLSRVLFGWANDRRLSEVEALLRWELLLDVVAVCRREAEAAKRFRDLRWLGEREQALLLLEAGVDPFLSELRGDSPALLDPDLADERGVTGLLNALVEKDLARAQLYIDAGADANRCGLVEEVERCPLDEAGAIPSLRLVSSLRRRGAGEKAVAGPDDESSFGESLWSRYEFKTFRSQRRPEPDFSEDESKKAGATLSRWEEDLVFDQPRAPTQLTPQIQFRLPDFFADTCAETSDDWEIECAGGMFTVRFRGRSDSRRRFGLRLRQVFGGRTADANDVAPQVSTGEPSPDGRWRRTLTGFRQDYLIEMQVEGSEWMTSETDALALRVFESFGVAPPPPLLRREQTQISIIVLLIASILSLVFVGHQRSEFSFSVRTMGMPSEKDDSSLLATSDRSALVPFPEAGSDVLDADAETASEPTTPVRMAVETAPLVEQPQHDVPQDVRVRLDVDRDTSKLPKRELFRRIESGELDEVRALLDAHPQALELRGHHNRRARGKTPLHFAIHCEQLDIANDLLDLGADPATTQRDDRARTALTRCVEIASAERSDRSAWVLLAERLVRGGADPDGGLLAALRGGTAGARADLVLVCLDGGADAERRVGPRGETVHEMVQAYQDRFPPEVLALFGAAATDARST